MLVPIEREHPDIALAQLLVDDVREERQVLHVIRRLVQQQGDVHRERNELGAHHHRVAELPLAILDAHILDDLQLEAVLPTLGRVEVADILGVRVHELVDLRDDGELLPLEHDVVVDEEEDVDGVLDGRLVVAGTSGRR